MKMIRDPLQICMLLSKWSNPNQWNQYGSVGIYARYNNLRQAAYGHNDEQLRGLSVYFYVTNLQIETFHADELLHTFNLILHNKQEYEIYSSLKYYAGWRGFVGNLDRTDGVSTCAFISHIDRCNRLFANADIGIRCTAYFVINSNFSNLIRRKSSIAYSVNQQ